MEEIHFWLEVFIQLQLLVVVVVVQTIKTPAPPRPAHTSKVLQVEVVAAVVNQTRKRFLISLRVLLLRHRHLRVTGTTVEAIHTQLMPGEIDLAQVVVVQVPQVGLWSSAVETGSEEKVEMGQICFTQ
jgi:hypothetical protein